MGEMVSFPANGGSAEGYLARPAGGSGKGVVVIHPRRTDYQGLTTGIPHQTGPRAAQAIEAAPEPKATA